MGKPHHHVFNLIKSIRYGRRYALIIEIIVLLCKLTFNHFINLNFYIILIVFFFVINFFKFGKKKKEIYVYNINVNDLQSWINSQELSKFEDLMLDVKSTIDNIKSAVTNINDNAKKLLDLDIGELGLPKNILTNILNSKIRFSKRLVKITDISIPQADKFLDTITIKKTVVTILSQIDEAAVTHGKLLFRFIPDKSKLLFESLKKLRLDLDILEKLIQPNILISDSFQIVKNYITNLDYNINNLKNEQSTLSEKDQNLKLMNQNLASATKSFEEISLDKTFLQNRNVNQLISVTKSEINEINNQSLQIFTKFTRPISKYSYTFGHSQPAKQLLDSYMAHPVNAIKNDVDSLIITELSKLSGAIQSGKIDTKNNTRIIELIEIFISDLPKIRPKIQTLESKLDVQSKQFDQSIENSYIKLKNSVETEKNKVVEVQNSVNHITNKIDTRKLEIKKQIKLIETQLLEKLEYQTSIIFEEK